MASQSSTPSLELVDSKAMEDAIEDEELSFVMAEDETDKVSDEMSRSKYSQVVFPQIAESYPNDCDIICKFAYNFDVPPTSSTSDRIGLYKVPYFQPHEYLAFRWVYEAKDNSLVFLASEIPKEEDFYQFQYLKTENGHEHAIGASIPFQIQIPKNEELCTVEDDEEFMVVRSKPSLVSEQMSGQLSSLSTENSSLKEKLQELEQKHKKLLEFSEKVQADLNKKGEACKQLEEELKTAKEDVAKLDQLKADLATVLQDKLVLEEKLHRFQKALQTIQTDRDLLAGERDQAIREKELLLKERDQVVSKNDEFKNMLNAATKAKELAVNELKANILSKDDQQRSMHNLLKRVDEMETLNQELVVINKDLIVSKDYEVNKIKEESKLKDAEIETLKHKVEIKNNEFELLRQEMVERSKTKFNEIDALQKQLSEAERNLARYVEGQNLLKEDSASTASKMSEDEKHSIEIKLEHIEKLVRDTRNEMKEFIMTKSASGSSAAFDTKSTVSVSSMTSTDSRHLLDDRVIRSKMVLNEPDEVVIDIEDVQAMTSPIKKKFNQVMEGFKTIENAPRTSISSASSCSSNSSSQVDQKIKFDQLEPEEINDETSEEKVAEGQSSKSVSRSPSLELGTSPTESRKNPLQRAQDTLSQFFPQIPNMMLSQLTPSAPIQVVEEYHERSKTPIREQPSSRGEMPEPLVPEVLTSRVRIEEEVPSSDFSDLVNWARGNLACTNMAITNSDAFIEENDNKEVIIITDDGRTLTREESRLNCPICDDTFGHDEVRALELHVDQHLATNLHCPVCNATFRINQKTNFEAHVQNHFSNEDEEPQMQRTWSFMDFD